MRDKRKSRWLQGCRLALSVMALGQFIATPVLADPFPGFPGLPGFPGIPVGFPGFPFPGGNEARTPIKHVIVIIGENRSFDHVFATYVPKSPARPSTTCSPRASSRSIQTRTRSPDRTSRRRTSWQPRTSVRNDAFLLSPPKQAFPNEQLPAPLVGGPKVSYIPNNAAVDADHQCARAGAAKQSETGLRPDYYQYLLTGGTGQTSKTPDQRITNVNALPAGPFQLTGSSMPYDSYAASPVHRFYQMWQQLNCNVSAASRDNPSGCNGKLFAWVEVTVGAGTNGAAQPANFSTEYSPTGTTTGEGSTALGFYNVQKGDVPYFTSLADNYAMSDNFHQSVNGGTGANHIMFGHADMIWYSDGNGHAAVPPNGKEVFTAPYMEGPNPDAGVVSEIENPNPAPGTNNWYTEDGYGNSYNAGYPPPYAAARFPAAVPTATVRIPRSPASSRSCSISSRCRVRSIRAAKQATIIS